jgi:4'-phosphopantetheinyl transferase
MNIQPWQESRKEINFSSGNIQIWSASLDKEDSSHFFNLLSEEEKKCTARLQSSAATCQKIISRGILRLLLGNYTGLNPKELVIKNSLFGKPFLSNPEKSKICFNLAHSGNMLLFAIGKVKHVGIDVEKIEEKIDFKGISPMVFSFDEQLTLSLSMDPIHYFYALWTAKEAILKVSGRGFSYPVNQFSVVIHNGTSHPSLIPEELTCGYSCSLSSFSPANGYSAAVAVLQ